jgi:hypothetical protein
MQYFRHKVGMFLIRYSNNQFCGSRINIPVPIFAIPGLRADFFSSRIRIKEFKYCNPKNCLKILGDMIRVVHPGSWDQKRTGSRIQLRNTGTNLTACVFVGMVCHVGKEEDRRSLIQATLDRFGGLDVLGGL